MYSKQEKYNSKLMEYTINKNGTIAVNGERLIMEDSNPAYKEYVKFLSEGGTVKETKDLTLYDIEKEVVSTEYSDRLLKSVRKMTTQSDAIEFLIAIIESMENKILDLEQKVLEDKGATGTFVLGNSKVSIKNGKVTSIKT
jgi:hypothetical protein